MHRNVFDDLAASWKTDQRAERPVAAWRDEGALAGRTPQSLVRAAHCGDRSTSEPALRALAGLADSDDLAAWTMLHMLLPAAAHLSARLRHHLPDDAGERALTVVELLWERIRTYPTHRQGTVSGNVLADVVNRITLGRRSQAWESPEGPQRASDSLEAELEDLAEPAGGPAAGEELIRLLAEAVAEGWIDQATAGMIGERRVLSVPFEVMAERWGINTLSARRRCLRAERRLIDAVATHARPIAATAA